MSVSVILPPNFQYNFWYLVLEWAQRVIFFFSQNGSILLPKSQFVHICILFLPFFCVHIIRSLLICISRKYKKMLCRTLLAFNAKQFSSLPGGKHYDVVISGSGMIGSTLACAIGKSISTIN